MKIQLISTLLLIFVSVLSAQNNNKYQEDFIELVKLVDQSYPLTDNQKDELKTIKPVCLKELESCSDDDLFSIVAQKYMAKLNDGHSKIKCYQSFTRKGHYTIRFNFINEKLYLSNYPNIIPKTYLGKQVVAINGVEIGEIIDKAKVFISADNRIDLLNNLKWLLNQPSFYDYIGIDANLELKLEMIDGSLVYWDRDLENKIFYMGDGKNKYTINLKHIKYYDNKENPLTGWSNKLFEYKILKESNVCYFNFRECVDLQWLNANKGYFKPLPQWLVKISWYFRGGSFSKFCKNMFNDINKKNVGNIIVDLRQNTGGTNILGHQLLDYLVDIDTLKNYCEHIILSNLLKNSYPDYFNELLNSNDLKCDSLPISIESSDSNSINKLFRDKESYYYQEQPKNKFKGDIYVMIGNDTFSSAAMIATVFADNNVATIVGNPMGMGATHNGEVLYFTLKNTGVKGTLSCKSFYRPDKNNLSRDLNVDVNVTNTELDVFRGIDKEFYYLINLIKDKK